MAHQRVYISKCVFSPVGGAFFTFRPRDESEEGRIGGGEDHSLLLLQWPGGTDTARLAGRSPHHQHHRHRRRARGAGPRQSGGGGAGRHIGFAARCEFQRHSCIDEEMEGVRVCRSIMVQCTLIRLPVTMSRSRNMEEDCCCFF